MDAKTVGAVLSAIAAAAAAYAGVTSNQASGKSSEVLAAALKQQGDAQLAGFELCQRMTERRVESGKDNVVPSVPKAMREMSQDAK